MHFVLYSFLRKLVEFLVSTKMTQEKKRYSGRGGGGLQEARGDIAKLGITVVYFRPDQCRVLGDRSNEITQCSG